jgi:hypothetical protein
LRISTAYCASSASTVNLGHLGFTTWLSERENKLKSIILRCLSKEEFMRSKDCKGCCNSYQHNKPHGVNDPRHQELLERIPYDLCVSNS